MMTHTLSNLIKTEYLKSIIFPLVVIESMLLMAYFWSNSFVNDVTKNALIVETKANIKEISQHSANVINSEFISIANVTSLFQKEHENFFSNYDPSQVKLTDSFYTQMADGVILNKPRDKNSCSLFFSNAEQNSPNRMAKAIASEKLDYFYNAALKTNSNIAQLYFNSYDSMNRLCPFMTDASAQYDHNINIPIFNFYFEADLAHNPEKKVVWTDAYLDPAGLGWMISAIAPVYKGDFLEGVVGVDVTIDKLIHTILSIKLPYVSMALMVDKKGNILAMNGDLEHVLGIKELKEHEYKEPVAQTITKPKDFNLLENTTNALAMHLANSIKLNLPLTEYNSEQSNFLVTQNTIQETGWKLILLLNKESLLASTVALKNKIDFIGYIAIGFMALFYLLFLAIIIKRSRNFSKLILTPLHNLVDATKDLKSTMTIRKLEHSHISEIDTLLDNFTSMSQELQELYESLDNKIRAGILENMETQKVMIYQSRLAQMGEMISMIAHQWRQPLGSISTVTAGIKLKQKLKKFDLETLDGRNAQIEYLNTAVDKIENYIHFLTTTIDDFRNFFKPDQEQVETTMKEIVDHALKIIGKSLEVHNITVLRRDESLRPFLTYSTQMTQVLINIIKNAQDALLEHKVEHGHLSIHSYETNQTFILEIEDNAGGIPEEIIDKIFDPYFSTKTDKNGTGLGLYMSKTIIEEHCRGILKAINTENGVKFVITIRGDSRAD
ncbi:MAG: ATP-binding protein [Sulfurospirillaceae bacterium]|nr:ATP-binding protein [Sulfurospirillaceae bacterium]MDD2826082.1 ATP-binding protein [Sulfurospirillaceae bacterium]